MYVNRYMNDKNWQRIAKLETFASERGHSLLELAFSWLAHRPVVPSVIAGAMSPEQVAMNVKAASWALSAEEISEIDQITA
jgi:aryl-alcohol dehydrogenase-like predicted oxidoreductase